MGDSKLFMILSVLVVAAVAKQIPIKDCGSKLATITAIDISPCPSIPCPFKKGTQINVTIGFTSKANINTAKSSVHGIISGLPVPFPLKDSDACHFMKCPIKTGDTVVYKNDVPVLTEYPSISVLVKWEIVAEAGDVACFTVPVKIVD